MLRLRRGSANERLPHPRPPLTCDGDVVHVVAALLGSDGRWLLARRPRSARHAGRWEFPGGKVETGESLAEALCRELGEELRLSLRPRDVAETLFQVELDEEGPPHLRLHFLRVAHWRGTPDTGEPGGVAWHFPAAMLELDLLPADRAVAEALATIDETQTPPSARGS